MRCQRSVSSHGHRVDNTDAPVALSFRQCGGGRTVIAAWTGSRLRHCWLDSLSPLSEPSAPGRLLSTLNRSQSPSTGAHPSQAAKPQQTATAASASGERGVPTVSERTLRCTVRHGERIPQCDCCSSSFSCCPATCCLLLQRITSRAMNEVTQPTQPFAAGCLELAPAWLSAPKRSRARLALVPSNNILRLRWGSQFLACARFEFPIYSRTQ